MKTPEKIKQSLECCRPQYDREHWITCYRGCSYTSEGCWCRNALHTDALSYIHQLELFVSQVSKALCGKENATLEEVLHAASQLKFRLAQV